MGKAFEKQTKTIEDQGERQIKAIQNQGEIKTIKNYTYDYENYPLISKQKEIFNELVDKRLEEITDLDKKVNSDNLIYRYKGRTADAKFDKFDNALDIINKIRNGEISPTDVKNNQVKFKSDLGEIKKAQMLYKARNDAIKFYDDYSLICLKQNLKQLKEQELQCELLNKCFKDCQQLLHK